jgi:uncharacterized protein YggU (UPF0235/DUF167 family)
MKTKTWTVEEMDFYLQTDEEIKNFFDTHWDIPISEIALMSGRSVAELKQLLLK